LFIKKILFFLIVFNCFLNSHADEKQLIINRLLEINNFTFNFKQVAQGKTEVGNCFFVFDNKLKCIYFNEKQKEIIINNKTLVVIQKKFNKTYFYPISKSPFMQILNKTSLINLVKGANLELKDNINIFFLDKNKKQTVILFDKENYNLIGWEIEDELQNKIYFSLKIQNINAEIDNNIFKIPSFN